MIERFQAGEWLACTRSFYALYPGRCVQCRRLINVGDPQVGVFSIKVKRVWMHSVCADRAGIPEFVGKS